MGISCGVLVPHARDQCGICGCFYSDGLLRLRHHFEVLSGLGDLPDLICQVQEGGASRINKSDMHATFLTTDQAACLVGCSAPFVWWVWCSTRSCEQREQRSLDVARLADLGF